MNNSMARGANNQDIAWDIFTAIPYFNDVVRFEDFVADQLRFVAETYLAGRDAKFSRWIFVLRPFFFIARLRRKAVVAITGHAPIFRVVRTGAAQAH